MTPNFDIHVNNVIDAANRLMGTLSLGTNYDAYKQLLCWAQTSGLLRLAGVEGTSFYDAALTLELKAVASKLLKSTHQTDLADAGATKATPSIRNVQPEQSWLATLRHCFE